jgi:hypothetical protein
MALMWLEYSYLTDEEYDAAVRHRSDRRTALSQDVEP